MNDRFCPDKALLAFYIEKRLKTGERRAVEEHLKECPDCLERVVDLREAVYLHRISRWNMLRRIREFFSFPGIVGYALPALVVLMVLLLVSIFQNHHQLRLDPCSFVSIKPVYADETSGEAVKGVVLKGNLVVFPVHGIQGAQYIKVSFPDGGTYTTDRVLIHEGTSTAFIQVEREGKIEYASSLRPGDKVYIVPFAGGRTEVAYATENLVVKSKGRSLGFPYVVIIRPSGENESGMVFNESKQLVGFAFSTDHGNVLFATLIEDTLAKLREREPISLRDLAERRTAEALHFYVKGLLSLDLQKKEEALELFKKATELDPYLEGPHIQLGNLYYEKRLYDLEIEEYKKVVKINPNNTDALFFLAEAYETKGMYHEAIELYETILKIDPEDSQTIFHLGLAYLTVGNLKKALALCPELKKLDPGYAEKLLRLAKRAG